MPQSNHLPADSRNRQPERCPACDDEAFSVLFQGTDRFLCKTAEPYRALQCARCGLIRLDPLPEEGDLKAHQPQSPWWESEIYFHGPYADAARRLIWRRQVSFIARSIRSPGPVLEFFGAGGLIAKGLRQRGISALSCHPSHAPLARGLKELGVPAARCRFSQPCFARGAFSAIAALHVLEHRRMPKASLQAMSDLLAKGGRLILKIPNAACWQALLLGQRWRGFDLPRHPFSFRFADIEGLLENCGFKILCCKYFSVLEDSTGLVTSLCPGLDPALRRWRSVRESTAMAASKNLLYGVLTMAALPLSILEAASGFGTSLMIEACRAGEENVGP